MLLGHKKEWRGSNLRVRLGTCRQWSVTRHKKERHGSNLRVRLQRNGIDAAHADSGMLLSQKEWRLAMCSDTDGLAGIMSSELSQTEEDKVCVITYVRNLENMPES